MAAPILSPRRERLAVLTLTLGALAMALNQNALAALLPFLGEEMLGDDAARGRLLSSAGFAGAIGAVALGPLSDRLGRRPPMLAGIAVFTLASLAHLLVRDRAELLAARAVAGFGVGVTYTAASAALADLVPYERRGAAMGVFTAGVFLAVPLGLPLTTWLASQGWWRGIFAAQTALGVLAAAGFVLLLPRGLGAGQRPPGPLLGLLREPGVVPALLSVLLYTGAFFTFVQFSGQWLHETALLPRVRQGWLWVALGVAAAAGSLLLGRLADRAGKRTFVLITTALVAAGLLSASHATSLAVLAAVGLPLALVASARTAALHALLSELVPAQRRGALMGARAAVVNLGQGVLPWAGGLAYAVGGMRSLGWLVTASALLALVLVWWGVPERMVDDDRAG